MPKKKDAPEGVHTRIKNPKLVRKKHLLIASKATKLFIKKGFQNPACGTSPARPKITLGNLYSYIKKKEDVLRLVFELYHKSYVSRFSKTTASRH